LKVGGHVAWPEFPASSNFRKFSWISRTALNYSNSLLNNFEISDIVL
jgi:hypothetical protein